MDKGPTAGIILAAGESRRWGAPKQLLDLNGRSLLGRVLASALASNLDRVVLVLGREHRRITDCLADAMRHHKLEVVFNPLFGEGQGSSLKAGLRRVRDLYPSAMFLLGDQPLVDPALINLLLERFAGSDRAICLPTHAGRQGPPTLFSLPLYPQLMEIAGDQGARGIIAAHPEEVLAVEIPDPNVFLDIDTREDFEKILRVMASSSFPDSA